MFKSYISDVQNLVEAEKPSIPLTDDEKQEAKENEAIK